MDRGLIFNKDGDSRKNTYVSDPGTPAVNLREIFPAKMVREDLGFSNPGELGVIRHFLKLASSNFSVDTNFYPLGSCTMKYNPKVNEEMANLKGFTDVHPYQRSEDIQGILELMYNLEKLLCEITGMKRFTLGPSSGAQGEFTGMLMIRKFHESKGSARTKVIVPDSAHGTNPATVSMCGYKTQVIESNANGLIDIDKLNLAIDQETAAIMLTNPNTLGLFEEDIVRISEIVHEKGGFLYYDGANFNPLLGITQPSLMGFDVAHLNLHKTFSTPHGCGGPGAGVVGVTEVLEDFLPSPLVSKKDESFYLDYDIKNSIGRIRGFYGNIGVLIRAYAYILRLGREGILRAAHNSVLSANYIREKLKKYYDVAYSKRCMHEVVFTCQRQKERGVSALDIAKRLIDYGIHPPTMYFPLIVKEALMVEPTETEKKEILDYFIETLINIDREIDVDPEKIKAAPHNAPVKRVDEVLAARFPDLRWKKSGA